MQNEEYAMAQKVIAEGHTSLVVKELEESIEQLRSEIEFLKEENKRLRNVSSATRTSNRKVRQEARDLISQVEEMGQHIMDIAAEEAGLVDGEPPITDYPNIEMFEGLGGKMVPLQKFESSPEDKEKTHAAECITRAWIETCYQDMRKEGIWPENFPLSPAEVYSDSTPDSEPTT